ncbi:M61 family metallopeptidase [Chitinibacter sp. S2-10]|uniref:M61 family metallopeptidase n=1 Tax=Chitinibacter sp. S2-10 TaxID=3373597 RepID=UPI003977566C
MSIHYTISALDLGAHLFAVELIVPEPAADGQLLTLPVWIPGSYLIREFARNIVQINASCNGIPVAISKINKSSWQAAPCAGALTVRYEVYAFDLSVRGAYLDQTRAFFNGTSVFLAADGQQNRQCDVKIKAGDFPLESGWKVATGLNAIQIDQAGFGSYQAKNYDELIDCPVEISDFAEITFEACGVPHRMVISGRHEADLSRLARDLKPICEYQIRLFGEPAPFDRYLFMTVAVGDGYGGLEHRNSTALICNRSDLPKMGDEAISNGYRQFLGLCSHEYFHSWNVKRIKPAAYAPYDLQQENYTTLLWAFEGITSYYDDLSLLRAGVISLDDYLDLLSQTATQVQRGYGRLRQSLEDSSKDTWVKYYRQDENSPNELVSYYTKGALVALCLDLHIRQCTGNQKSLDDVMRALWQRYGQHFERDGLGVGEQEWEQIAAEVTGLNLQPFFDRALRSTEELPLAQSLACLGVESQLRISNGNGDKGGWQETVSSSSSWGLRFSPDPAGVKLTHVLRSQAACLAGLAAGDLIIAVAGLRVSASQFERLMSESRTDQALTIHAFRRDELMNFELRPQNALADTFGFKKSKELSQQQEINMGIFVGN